MKCFKNEPTSSAWSSPIVLVDKKDKSLRVCVDYRKLNAVSEGDVYPMPRVDELIDKVGQSKYISALDLSKGYWQVPIAWPMVLFSLRLIYTATQQLLSLSGPMYIVDYLLIMFYVNTTRFTRLGSVVHIMHILTYTPLTSWTLLHLTLLPRTIGWAMSVMPCPD